MSEPASGVSDPLVGTTLGERYRVLARLGEGGMGIVYEAEHVVIEKRVALKVLRDDFSSRPEVVERFRQEAKSASRIGHEHIVDIQDFGETPTGQSYFVMEKLEGEDLANVLARDSVLPWRRAARIALQCCRALGAAHVKGIIHRDMKPENVFLVTREGSPDFVKIVDFGIAKMSDGDGPGGGRKLTKTGMIFGTPEYMSPEQAAGKKLDHRVDVYAVGVILFETVTGRVPFVGDNFMGILTQHMFDPVPNMAAVNPRVEIPPELERLVQRALAKSADERFGSMTELAEAITQLLEGGVSSSSEQPTLPGHGTKVNVPFHSPRRVLAQNTLVEELSAPTRKIERRSATGWALPAIVAVAASAGIGLFALKRDGAAPLEAGPTPEPRLAAAAAADPGVPTAPAPSVEPGPLPTSEPAPRPSVAPASGALATVRVSVLTTPPGARVEVSGRGEVCAETPCSFETEPGKPLQIEASKRGRLASSREITPTEATTIELALTRRAPRAARPGAPTDVPEERPRGDAFDPRASDLKMPDLFRGQ